MDKWWDSLSALSKILVIGLILLIVTCLFPPWEYTFSFRGIYSAKPAGYHFLFSPPMPLKSDYAFGVKINFIQLLIEWVAIVAFVIVMLFTVSNNKKTKSLDEDNEQ